MIRILSGAFLGLESITIEIEIDIRSKLKSFEIVGLPSIAVKESSKRVEAAIINSGFHFPGKQIVINLAPAGIKKIGTLFDLPIALGIIAEESDLIIENDIFIVGELSLDGKLKKANGVLLLAEHASNNGFTKFICPKENAQEAALIKNITVIAVESLTEAHDILTNKKDIPKINAPITHKKQNIHEGCFSDVKGQESAKRALEIAVAGNHNILMLGPPGTGKTMLAKRLPTIFPYLTMSQALEVSKLYSIIGMHNENTLIHECPFRAPHHTASDVSIVGGGRFPKPGEISLAHHGILFLDEMQEFNNAVLQVLRQPLEEKKITISRAEGAVDFPANFMLVGAMNPSREALHNHYESWNTEDIKRLIKKFSHPFLDRIDMHIQVGNVPYEKLDIQHKGETSLQIKKRVELARQIQQDRFASYTNIYTNADMSTKLLEKHCEPTSVGKDILKMAMTKLNLSLRSYNKIIKCARTIADLNQEETISEIHISEALQYRILDRIISNNY